MKKLLARVTCSLLLLTSMVVQAITNQRALITSLKVHKYKNINLTRNTTKIKQLIRKRSRTKKLLTTISNRKINNLIFNSLSHLKASGNLSHKTIKRHINKFLMVFHMIPGFLNTYGMSPVAYKIKNGMSSYSALKSTPNSMKTSGDMQTEYAMDIWIIMSIKLNSRCRITKINQMATIRKLIDINKQLNKGFSI